MKTISKSMVMSNIMFRLIKLTRSIDYDGLWCILPLKAAWNWGFSSLVEPEIVLRDSHKHFLCVLGLIFIGFSWCLFIYVVTISVPLRLICSRTQKRHLEKFITVQLQRFIYTVYIFDLWFLSWDWSLAQNKKVIRCYSFSNIP